jgi:hypothetical protein
MVRAVARVNKKKSVFIWAVFLNINMGFLTDLSLQRWADHMNARILAHFLCQGLDARSSRRVSSSQPILFFYPECFGYRTVAQTGVPFAGLRYDGILPPPRSSVSQPIHHPAVASCRLKWRDPQDVSWFHYFVSPNENNIAWAIFKTRLFEKYSTYKIVIWRRLYYPIVPIPPAGNTI